MLSHCLKRVEKAKLEKAILENEKQVQAKLEEAAQLAAQISTTLYAAKKGEVAAKLEKVGKMCSAVATGKQGTAELEEALLKTKAAANTLREDKTQDVSQVEA